MTTELQREALVVPVELKATGSGKGEPIKTLEGYASTFGNVDHGRDVVKAGAFTKTIKEAVVKGEVPLLIGHDHSDPGAIMGTVVSARQDDKGLFIKASIATDSRSQAIARKIAEGHVKKMSIGYVPTKSSFGEIDGKGVRFLEEVKLVEISVVAVPMNPEASITRVKDADGGGFDAQAALADEFRKAAALGTPAARVAAYDALVKALLAESEAAAQDAAGTSDGDEDAAELAAPEAPESKDADIQVEDVDPDEFALKVAGLWTKPEPRDDALGGEPEHTATTPVTSAHMGDVKSMFSDLAILTAYEKEK